MIAIFDLNHTMESMPEMSLLLKRKLGSILSDPAVVSCRSRLHKRKLHDAGLTPHEMLLIERINAAESAVEKLGSGFETASFLHAGNQVALAEKSIVDYYNTEHAVESIELMKAVEARDGRRKFHAKSNKRRSPSRSSPQHKVTSPGWMRGRDGVPVVQHHEGFIERQKQLSQLAASVKEEEYRAARQLEAEQDLRNLFDSLVNARKRLRKARRQIDYTDVLSPQNRLAAATLSVEAAEAKFAMAEWRCKKAPAVGDKSFIDATSDAIEFAREAHSNLDVLQVELQAIQHRGLVENDIHSAEKAKLDRMLGVQAVAALKTDSGHTSHNSSISSVSGPSSKQFSEQQSPKPMFSTAQTRPIPPAMMQGRSPHRNHAQQSQIAKTLSKNRGLVPALAAREAKLLKTKMLKNGESLQETSSPDSLTSDIAFKNATIEDGQKVGEENTRNSITQVERQRVIQQRAKRLEDDAMRAYMDIQVRLKREKQRKESINRRQAAQKEALKRQKEEALAAQVRKSKFITSKRRWIRFKNRTLDIVRKKNNRMGAIRKALKLKFDRERMCAEDMFAKFLRKSEKVVSDITNKALESVWRQMGPMIEKHGHPEKAFINDEISHTGDAQLNGNRRPNQKLFIPVLHVTPGPLFASQYKSSEGKLTIDLQSTVKWGNKHPLSQFFASAQSHLHRKTGGFNRQEFEFLDFRSFDGEFPTGAEQRKAHAYILLGDVLSGDDPFLCGSTLRNPLAAFVRNLVESKQCVLAMGAGHVLLARTCSGSPWGEKLKRRRLKKWESGPMIVTPTSMGVSDTLWKEHATPGSGGSVGVNPPHPSDCLKIFHAHDSIFLSAPPGFKVIAQGCADDGENSSSVHPRKACSPREEIDHNHNRKFVAAMRYGMNVLSFSGYPFLGPASFRESIARFRDQQTMRKDIAEIKRKTFIRAKNGTSMKPRVHQNQRTGSVSSTIPDLPSMPTLCRRTDSSTVAAVAFAHLLRGARALSPINTYTFSSDFKAGVCIVANGCASARVPLCSMEACKKVINEQGSDVVCIGVVVSEDGICMAAPSPWLPNLVNVHDMESVLRDQKYGNAQSGRAESSFAATHHKRSIDDLQNGIWSINADNWIDRSQHDSSMSEVLSSETTDSDKHNWYDSQYFVQNHSAKVLRQMERSYPGKWERQKFSSNGTSILFNTNTPRGAQAPKLATLTETLQSLICRKGTHETEHESTVQCKGVWLVPVHGVTSKYMAGASHRSCLPAQTQITASMLQSSVRASGFGGEVTLATFDEDFIRKCRHGFGWNWKYLKIMTLSEGQQLSHMGHLELKTTMARLGQICGAICIDKGFVLPQTVRKVSASPGVREARDISTFDVAARSRIIQAAHAQCIQVFARGFSAAPGMIPGEFSGRPQQEYIPYILAQVDGIVTSFPQHANAARSEILRYIEKKRRKHLDLNKRTYESDSTLQEQPVLGEHEKGNPSTGPEKLVQHHSKKKNSFIPARPILRRTYITGTSPRAKRGLRTRWVPRQNPELYSSGVNRIARIASREERKRRIARSQTMKKVLNGGSHLPREVSANVYHFYSTLAGSISSSKRTDPLEGFTSV